MNKGWLLKDWCDAFADKNLPPMTEKEKSIAVKYLRAKNYPKPDDCKLKECPKHRPACDIGICVIATIITGDF